MAHPTSRRPVCQPTCVVNTSESHTWPIHLLTLPSLSHTLCLTHTVSHTLCLTHTILCHPVYSYRDILCRCHPQPCAQRESQLIRQPVSSSVSRTYNEEPSWPILPSRRPACEPAPQTNTGLCWHTSRLGRPLALVCAAGADSCLVTSTATMCAVLCVLCCCADTSCVCTEGTDGAA